MENRALLEIAQFRIDADPFYIFNFPAPWKSLPSSAPEVRMKKASSAADLRSPKTSSTRMSPTSSSSSSLRSPTSAGNPSPIPSSSSVNAAGVKRIVFVGSFGAPSPLHPRAPPLWLHLPRPPRGNLTSYNLRASDYAGPSSFSTLLTSQALPRHRNGLLSPKLGYLNGETPLH